MTPKRYLQVCIAGPEEGTSGAYVRRLLDQVLLDQELPWVAISDLDGTGGARPLPSIDARHVQVMPTASLLALIDSATQIVWCSIFLCRARAIAETIRADETYQASMQKAEITVRVVDVSYVYVTGQEATLRSVVSHLPPGETRIGSVDEMEFPE